MLLSVEGSALTQRCIEEYNWNTKRHIKSMESSKIVEALVKVTLRISENQGHISSGDAEAR